MLGDDVPDREDQRRVNESLGLAIGAIGVALLVIASALHFPSYLVMSALVFILLGLRSAWNLWRHRRK